ncbi:MAG TPA: hypothetical protein VJN18_14765 [Polyangiaceae bacterium]|nr:hypothetical protein [Polyangiaceae bacterium]
MSPTTIKAKGEREALVYDTASQIRELLDNARKQYPEDDQVEVEERILELVTGEDE